MITKEILSEIAKRGDIAEMQYAIERLIKEYLDPANEYEASNERLQEALTLSSHARTCFSAFVEEQRREWRQMGRKLAAMSIFIRGGQSE